MEVHQKVSWYAFKKKWDQDEPPAMDDGGTVSRHHKKNEDPYDLNERYYRWGVKPDWLQIHRIIAHESVVVTVVNFNIVYFTHVW